MLGTVTSRHTGHHEVNLREHAHMPLPGANQAAHSGFKTQTRHHQKSKTGVSVAPQKGLMSPKILLKMKNANKITIKKTCTDGLAFPETNIRIPRIQFNSAEYLDSSERLFINSFEILNRSVRKTNIYWNEIYSYQDGWIWQPPLCEKRINSRLTVCIICSKFRTKS